MDIQHIVSFIHNNSSYVSMTQLKNAHFSTAYVRKCLDDGIIEKIKPGLYRLTDMDDVQLVPVSYIDISRAIPDAVICLFSSLQYHGLTTFNPAHVYAAIPHDMKKPSIIYPPVKIFYLRENQYSAGIITIKTEYGDIKIYNREKTVCDMYRYRKKLGEDSAIEALKLYLNSNNSNMQSLKHFSEICRVKNIITPYIKAIVG
jgi:predicted transcriptional regulator of viral defense system